jgi:hypothetical protein
MRIRRVDQNGDMTFGNSSADFWVNVPDGVAQAIASTLNLWAGQWFLDSTAGVQWDAKVLGNRTASTRDMVIQAAILGVPGVLTILSYSSNINRSTRAFTASGSVQTQFGPAPFQFRQFQPGPTVPPITDDSGAPITGDGGAPITP